MKLFFKQKIDTMSKYLHIFAGGPALLFFPLLFSMGCLLANPPTEKGGQEFHPGRRRNRRSF